MKRNKTTSVLLIIFFVLLFGALGYYRDVLFRHVNSQISVLEYSIPPFEFFKGFGFIGEMTLSSLYKLKWIATISFFLIHWGISLLILRIWFNKKIFYQFLHLSYTAVFLLSAFAYCVGWMIPGAKEQSYYFSRWLMGAGQSPIIIMLLLAVIIPVRKMSYDNPGKD